jgi:hypothetical protein
MADDVRPRMNGQPVTSAAGQLDKKPPVGMSDSKVEVESGVQTIKSAVVFNSILLQSR